MVSGRPAAAAFPGWVESWPSRDAVEMPGSSEGAGQPAEPGWGQYAHPLTWRSGGSYQGWGHSPFVSQPKSLGEKSEQAIG